MAIGSNEYIHKTENTSRKHVYIILIPLKPHFYIVKLGFTGVHIIFLISAQNIDCGYLLEPPHFLSENFQFLCGKIFNIFE